MPHTAVFAYSVGHLYASSILTSSVAVPGKVQAPRGQRQRRPCPVGTNHHPKYHNCTEIPPRYIGISGATVQSGRCDHSPVNSLGSLPQTRNEMRPQVQMFVADLRQQESLLSHRTTWDWKRCWEITQVGRKIISSRGTSPSKDPIVPKYEISKRQLGRTAAYNSFITLPDWHKNTDNKAIQIVQQNVILKI